MQQNFKMQLLLILTVSILFNGCSTKVEYFQANGKLYKKTLEIAPKLKQYESLETQAKYNRFKKETKNIDFNGYNIKYLRAEPYLKSRHYYANVLIGLKDEYSFSESHGLISYSKYTFSYTYMMFTLNQEPFNKNMLPYFNTLNTTYENKLNPKDINKFVKYDCDKNIIFDKWERDQDYKPLEATCYAKRLDKDVFLITRFAHPNTQKDKKLFEEEIIPTMLKSIKVTPTKLSPWKHY